MMKKTLFSALFLAVIFPVAAAADSLAKFEGGIGVIPVSNVAGAQNADGTFPNVSRNVVRGVNPAGQIWVIAGLNADVGLDSQITVDGRGLLLGGGNNIGGNANANVIATLLCGNVQHSSAAAGVPLEPNGDFRIDDVLSPVPPTVCANPVLLIRNVVNLGWFAAGIPKL
jgi:hypothetical protein